MMAALLPKGSMVKCKKLTFTRLQHLLVAFQYVSKNIGQPFSSHGTDETMHEKLSKRQYWKNQYQNSTQTFDWFLPEEVVCSFVRHSLLNVASKKAFQETPNSMLHRVHPVNVLDLGCGQSTLPLYFYEWTPFPVAVHFLDYVQEAVEFQMQNLRSIPKGHPHTYAFGVCASVCSLPFQSDLFHVVTDKGTLDAVLRDPISGTHQAKEMLKEVERVLKRGGSFMQITDEDPDSRMYFLETHSSPACRWQFSIFTDSLDHKKECFVYSFSK